MTFTPLELGLLFVVVLAAGFLIHKYLPNSAVAKAEDKMIAGIKKAEPDIKAEVKSIVITIEEDAWKAVEAALAKAADLTAAKATADSAAAAYQAAQKRLADFKASVQALPSA